MRRGFCFGTTMVMVLRCVLHHTLIMNTDSQTNDTLLATLAQCETNVWDALVNGDMQADDAALADGFLGVYSDGFANKADHVQQLASGPTVDRYALSDLRAKPLGDGFALLSYRAAFLRKGQTDFEAMYVSSIWQRTEDGWINVFSQDTAATD